jgi:hypothetical protein
MRNRYNLGIFQQLLHQRLIEWYIALSYFKRSLKDRRPSIDLAFNFGKFLEKNTKISLIKVGPLVQYFSNKKNQKDSTEFCQWKMTLKIRILRSSRRQFVRPFMCGKNVLFTRFWCGSCWKILTLYLMRKAYVDSIECM